MRKVFATLAVLAVLIGTYVVSAAIAYPVDNNSTSSCSNCFGGPFHFWLRFAPGSFPGLRWS